MSGADLVEWASAGVPLVLGTESGDLCSVTPFDGGVLVAVIDGLGHGPEAASAAKIAASVLRENAADDPKALIERCHIHLRSTRGAAVTLASLREPGELTWIGVGNVEAVLLPGDRSRPKASVLLRGGIVGLRLPPLREYTVAIAPRDTLVIATDGIRSNFEAGCDRDASPDSIAESILSGYRKTSDDALVVVARWQGAP